MDKLTISHLAPYLPYKLQMQFEGKGGRIITLTGITDQGNAGISITNWHGGMWLNGCGFKPLLRPLSQLTHKITHNGVSMVFTDLFEIGDDVGYNYEFDHGNVKLIKQLESISKNNCHNDIKYLPFAVVQEMIKYYFDIHGLIESGLALPYPSI